MNTLISGTGKAAMLFLYGFSLLCHEGVAQGLLNPATQPKFVHALPIPDVIDATSGGTHTMYIEQFHQDLGLRGPTGEILETKVWGYRKEGAAKGTYPGPTFVAKKNVGVKVFWHNNLKDSGGNPLPHFLPVDLSLHWALQEYNNADWASLGVPTVTHLHGGHTESASDGLPEAWYTPDYNLKGHDFVKGDVEPYHYHNTQNAATIWYHDHALGITRLNVYAGLAGFYLITDEVEQNLKMTLKLPADPYDVGLAIQDRKFTADGQLFIPSETPEVSHPSILPEFFGDFILVNGKIWPVHDVEPRQYRYRVLNGSDSRFYEMHLSNDASFWQVGSDNGLLPAPVKMSKLVIGPGERKDVIIDFSGMMGQTIILKNRARSPYPKGATPNPKNEGEIMAFRVSQPLNMVRPLTPVPATLIPALPAPPEASKTRKLILFEGTDHHGRLLPMLGTVEHGPLKWHDEEFGITENPALNSTEVWEIYNLTPDAHPVHLHLVSFRVLNTQKFTATVSPEGIMSNVRLLGMPKAPDPADAGYKDTYPVMPGELVRLNATFDREGLYAWHCHVLSHEDHEMMRPYYVGQIPAEGHTMDSYAHIQKTIVAEQSLSSAGIYQIYPNPFQTSASLHLRTKGPSDISIRIYDMKGSLVKEISNKRVADGEHNFTIDGRGINQGLYICEVSINGKFYRDRLMITK